MDYALSSDDMIAWLPHANFLTYTMLANAVKNGETLDDILGQSGVAVLLYRWTEQWGHWTILMRGKNPNHIELFDSLGGWPDERLQEVPKDFRKESEQDHSYLLWLLYDTPGITVKYNDFPLQLNDPSVATCGRWAILRVAFRDKSIEEFEHMFDGIRDRDALITKVFEIVGKKYGIA